MSYRSTMMGVLNSRSWALCCDLTHQIHWPRGPSSVARARGLRGVNLPSACAADRVFAGNLLVLTDSSTGVDPDAALLFNRAMVSLTNSVAAALVREGDFSGVKCLADLGGGLGQLLSSVLLAYPTMRGILFDMAHATQTAGAQLAAAGVATRCEVVTGSFFDAIPEGADAYLLKSFLHDWNDEDCAQILVNCSKAMLPHARLMIIERMMPEQLSVCPHDQGVARSDLNMLVGNGGCERTQEQYRVMLQKVGLRMGEPQALCDNYQVIEAVLVL